MNIWYRVSWAPAPGPRMMETVRWVRDKGYQHSVSQCVQCPAIMWWHLHNNNDCMMYESVKCTLHCTQATLGMCGARCWASDVSWHLVTSPPLLALSVVTLCPSSLSPPGPGLQVSSGVMDIHWECNSTNDELVDHFVEAEYNVMFWPTVPPGDLSSKMLGVGYTREQLS